jgi:hypothetical protein
MDISGYWIIGDLQESIRQVGLLSQLACAIISRTRAEEKSTDEAPTGGVDGTEEKGQRPLSRGLLTEERYA